MPLFCSSCVKVVNGKYCVHCGAVVKGAETIATAKDEKPLSFAAHFINKNQTTEWCSIRKGKKIDRREKDVLLIHASLLLAVKRALIQERGSRLPVTVNASWVLGSKDNFWQIYAIQFNSKKD